MKREALTYAKAIDRLEEIVRKLEAGETSVDELSAMVREGVDLAMWCRRKLRTAQAEVEAALANLEETQSEENGQTSRSPSNKTPRAPKATETDAGLFAAEEDASVGEEGLEPPAYSV